MTFLILFATSQFQLCSELAFHEKYDRATFPSGKEATGTVLTISRAGIQMRLIGGLWAETVATYPTHRRLSQGLHSLRSGEAYAYGTSDVRTGDMVTVCLCSEQKTEYCFALSIWRRPGGKVPPSRSPADFASYSERINAIRDNIETGKPMPGYLRLGVSRADYPFADPDVPANKRIKRFPHDNPFSYIEYLIFMR